VRTRWIRAASGVALLAGLLAGCGTESPMAEPGEPAEQPSCDADRSAPVAGNVISWFFTDVQQGRDPRIEGGVSDPFGCAYGLLCRAQQDRVSENQFRTSRGEAISDALSADTWAGPSVYVDRGLAEGPDLDTDDPSVEATWSEAELSWYRYADDGDGTVGLARLEHWRIDLVREAGEWRLCDLHRVRVLPPERITGRDTGTP
jgi:hypothetical protein